MSSLSSKVHVSSGRGKSKQLESVVTRPPKKVQRGGLRLVGWPTGSEAAMTHLNGSPDVPLDAEARDVPVANFATGRPPEADGEVDGEVGSALAVTPTSSREVA